MNTSQVEDMLALGITAKTMHRPAEFMSQNWKMSQVETGEAWSFGKAAIYKNMKRDDAMKNVIVTFNSVLLCFF